MSLPVGTKLESIKYDYGVWTITDVMTDYYVVSKENYGETQMGSITTLDFDNMWRVVSPIEPVQYYHVRYVGNNEDIKIFTDVDNARAFRDGWNFVVPFGEYSVKVTTTVTEMQPVEIEKEIK